MQEVLNDILGTFLGALLGIPAGIALNQAWSKRVSQARRMQLRFAIRESVKKNEYLVGEIENWLGGEGRSPSFNIDLALLESTASLKYEVLNDIALCREIDYLRYELVHLGRKLDLLLDLEFNPASRLAVDDPRGSFLNILRPRLVESIKLQLEPIKSALRSLDSKLS